LKAAAGILLMCPEGSHRTFVVLRGSLAIIENFLKQLGLTLAGNFRQFCCKPVVFAGS